MRKVGEIGRHERRGEGSRKVIMKRCLNRGRVGKQNREIRHERKKKMRNRKRS